MEKDLLKNIELIEAWHEGKLDEAGKSRVQNLLNIDSQFKEEFDLYHILVAGIKSQPIVEIKRKLKEIDQEMDRKSVSESESTKVRKLFRMPLSIAATIAMLLLAVSTWVYYSKFSKNAIISQYYIEDSGLPVYMSNDSNKDFDEAMNQYKLEHYEESLTAIQGLLLSNPSNDTLLYYSGVNLLKLEQPDAAEVFFKHVFEMSDSEFYQAAGYRQIICLWLQGNNREANRLFEEFSPLIVEKGYRQSLQNILK